MSELRTIPWYDRNAISKANSYDSTLGPHSATTRISSYTVAKNKKAMLELVSVAVTRESASANIGMATAWFTLVPKDADPEILVLARIYDNNAGAKDKQQIGSGLVLHEGDILTGLTADASSDGGSVRYVLAYKISEFDAFPIEAPPFQIELPRRDIQESLIIKDPPM